MVGSTKPNPTPPPHDGTTDPRQAVALVHGRTSRQRLTETLWELFGQPLFRISFHNWYGIRNRILNIFGAHIHPTARIRPTVKITHPWKLTIGANTAVGDHAILFCLGPVSVGARCTISQYSHLCAASHDFTRKDMRLVTPGITIGDDAWIAADAFVGPGINIGEGAILGSRASAYKDLKEWTIYGGDTAKPLGERAKLPPIPGENQAKTSHSTHTSERNHMTGPLKIAHFSGPIRLELGGVVRAILDMAIAQAKAGHDVVVATWDTADVPDDWAPGKLGVPRVIEIPPPTKFGKLSKNAEDTLSRTIGSCDVVHMHTPWELSNASIAKLCKKLGTPYIISIHGMLDDWSMAQRKLKKQIYLALSARILLENAFAVHCTAQAELNQSKRYYPKGNGVVVPLLFDIKPYLSLPGKKLAQQAFDIDSNKPVVLFLSRVHVKKGIHILIDAAKLLKDKGVDAQFLIAGTGDDDYEQQLQTQIKTLGLESSVRLLGMVRGTEKVSLYQAADVFALPTSQENFGFVLVEALACSTPAITTKFVDIWPELQESGSSLIVEQSAQVFADTIRSMLDDESERTRMGKLGRDWVFDTLSPEAVVKRYESLYREAARNRS